MAARAEGSGSPSTTPSAPVTIVVICMLDANHTANRLRGRPWRSPSGTKSVVCCSTPNEAAVASTSRAPVMPVRHRK